MMKVQNIRNATFSSSNRLEKWIIPEEYKSKYILNGYVKQARAYKKIATIPVENTDMKKVLLENGEEYKIITFDKDYEDYLNAYKKGIKILTNWAIIGKKEKRYIMFGKVEGQDVKGEISEQDNNYIHFKSGEKYFVMWNQTYFRYNEQMYILRKMSDLLFEKYGGLTNFGGIKIKPNIIL